MNTWKTYGWHIGLMPIPPPCGVGPVTVKARSTREAARKFWAVFCAITKAQMAGIPIKTYRKYDKRK